MPAMKSHPGRGAVSGGDHLLDPACETPERVMHRSHITDETVGAAQFGTERTTETKIARKNTASFGLIGLVPNAMVKPFYKLSRG
jgi:hypothetical protein